MITAQEVLDALAPQTLDPDLVALLIGRATATLGREVGFYLGPPMQVVDFVPGGRLRFWLHNDVQGALVLERSNGPNDPFTAIPASGFVLEGRRVTVAPRYGACDYRATYTAGYDPAAIPPPPQELAQLVRQMVLASLESAGAIDSTSPLKSETIGDYSYTRQDLLAAVVAMGDDWTTFVRRWRRGLL